MTEVSATRLYLGNLPKGGKLCPIALPATDASLLELFRYLCRLATRKLQLASLPTYAPSSIFLSLRLSLANCPPPVLKLY